MDPASRNVRAAVVLGTLFSFSLFGDAPGLKPLRGYPVLPRDYGILYEEVAFDTPDSVRLVGWFYPAQDTAGIANDLVGRVVPVPEALRRPARPHASDLDTITPKPSRRPTVVICDGDGGNMSDLILYAYNFFTRGFNVFTFDWRGFGGSAEWSTDRDQLCYTEFLRDYEAALGYVKTRPEVDPQRVALLGFSTGAYLSFAMLPDHPEIAAFAGRALLTSFDDLLPIVRQLDSPRNWHAPADYPAALLPVNAAPRVRAPVFLIVGDQDPRTPPWMSKKIHQALPGRKELWVVPGAGHGGPTGPEMTNYPEFFERVAAFFRQQM